MGLAAASIVLFLFFFIKRRRRTRRIEYDTAVASTLAAAGFNRTPLDGDDEGRGMSQRRGSNVSAFHSMSTMPSTMAPYTDEPPVMAAAAGMSGRPMDFDPYAAYAAAPPRSPSGSSRRDGYAPARTSSPPLGHSHNDSQSYAMMGGHIPRESAGSFEPLLAAAGMAPTQSMPPTPSTLEPAVALAPPIPPKSPRRMGGSSEEGGVRDFANRDSASSVYSNDEADDQLVDLLPKPLEVSFIMLKYGGRFHRC